MREVNVQYNHDFQTTIGKLTLGDDYVGLYDLIQKGEIFLMSAIVHNDSLVGVSISPQIATPKLQEYDRDSLVNILVYHWQTNTSGCGCGWAELGKSWPEHIANVYEMEITTGG